MMMGKKNSVLPGAMDAAAPGGAPPRRIKD